MNSTPLLLLPIATVALLSSQPSKAPVADSKDSAQVAEILNHPEIRALTDSLQQAAEFLQSPEELNQMDHRGHHGRVQKHELGLHTGTLSAPGDLTAPESYFSPARGLTPEDEWERLFPRYAAKLAAAR